MENNTLEKQSKFIKENTVIARIPNNLFNSLEVTSKRLKLTKSEVIRQGIEKAIESI